MIVRNVVAGVVLITLVIFGGAVSCKVVDEQSPDPPPEPKIVQIENHICTLVEKEKPNSNSQTYTTYECKEGDN